MRQGTRRTFALGASLALAATAFATAPISAQDEVPQGGTIVVGEWQRATQLNPFLSNALRDVEGSRPAQRTLAAVNDQGEFVPELLAEFPTQENGGIVLDEDGVIAFRHVDPNYKDRPVVEKLLMAATGR